MRSSVEVRHLKVARSEYYLLLLLITRILKLKGLKLEGHSKITLEIGSPVSNSRKVRVVPVLEH